MDKLEEIIRADPARPRLVVRYRRTPSGGDGFEWGIVGSMPVLSLVGFVARVQGDLQFRSPEPTEQSALVILYNQDRPESDRFTYFVHPDIPADALVGMLEVVKMALVGSQVGQRAAAQRVSICGPDGRPMRG